MRGDYSFYLALRRNANPEEVIRLTTQAMEDGSSHAAEAQIERSKAWFQNGLDELSAENFTASISCFSNALSDRINFQEAHWKRSEAYYQLAISAINEDDLGQALEHLDQALKDNPGDPQSHATRAEVHFRLGQQELSDNPSKARAHFLAALEDVQEFPEARTALVEATAALGDRRFRTGSYGEAVKLFDEVLNLSSDNIGVMRLRAMSVYQHWQLLEEQAKPGLLKDLYRSIQHSHHLGAELTSLLYSAASETELLNGNYRNAIDQADKALGHLESSEKRNGVLKTRGLARYHLALKVVAETGDLPLALELLDLSVKDNASIALWAEVRRGEVHATVFDYETAAKHARNAYRRSDDSEINFHAGYNLARYLSILTRTEEALSILSTFLPEPENYGRARQLARAEGDFYHLFSDRRFQAWIDGRKRLKLNITQFDINICEEEFGAGVCDPYFVVKEGNFVLHSPNYYWQDKLSVKPKSDYLIADFSLNENISINFWDIDSAIYKPDDFIGIAWISRRQLISGGNYRNAIQNKYGNVGYVSFSLRETQADLDASAPHMNPSIGTISWPVIGCLSEFGIGTLIQPIHLKGSLLELNSSFMGEEFTLQGALERFGALFLKKLLLSSGVRLGLRFTEMLVCLGSSEE